MKYLQGYGLSDEVQNPFKWRFGYQLIGPGEYITVMASGKNKFYQELSPDSLPELVAWFSASSVNLNDPAQVEKSGDQWVVKRWNSRKNNYVASQTNLSNSPVLVLDSTGKQRALRFNGTSHFLKSNVYPPTGNKPRTFIVIISNTNTTTANKLTSNYLFQYGNYDKAYGAYFEGVQYSGKIGMHYWKTWFLGSQRIDNQFKVLTFSYNGEKDSYYVNGKFAGSQLVNLTTENKEPLNIASRLGSGNGYYGGDIHELLVFDGALSPDLMRRVENFLAVKQGHPRVSSHTNFKLSTEGETLVLTSPDQSYQYTFSYPLGDIPDVSYGNLQPGNEKGWFSSPSPSYLNSKESFSTVCIPPVLSHPSGFYEDSLVLSLTASGPDEVVLYTLDGSIPDPNALAGRTYTFKNEYKGSATGADQTRKLYTYTYSEPLVIKPFLSTNGNLAKVVASTTSWTSTNQPIPRATVIRAAVWKEGALMSPVVSSTFFVDTIGKQRFHLPVLSVTVSEDELISYDNGIYVPGRYYDETKTSGNPDANYKHDEWERPGHFTLFDQSGKIAFESNAGVKIHGKFSVQWPRKSLKLKAQKKFGAQAQFEHEFFPGLTQKPTVGFSPIRKFNKVNLRNSGIQWNTNLFHDAFVQRLFDFENGDFQASYPVIHLLNGEFWGIMNIREEFDQYYFSEHYSMDPDELIIINAADMTVNEGYEHELDDYKKLEDFIQNNDLSIPENFEYVKGKMDIQSYLYHFMSEIYTRNTDFINNNRKVWRKRTEPSDSNAPYGHDGRWRWISFDYDLTLKEPATDYLTEISVSNTQKGSLILRKLLQNENARNLFVTLFCDRMNTSLLPAYAEKLFDRMNAAMSDDLPAHQLRWGHPASDQKRDELLGFLRQRPGYMYQHLKKRFNFTDTVRLTLVADAQKGSIKLNSITIDSLTPRSAMDKDVYPWSGVYFKDVPLQLTAVAAPGYKFSHWSTNATSEQITVNLSASTTLTAFFTSADVMTDTLVINELNYNSNVLYDPGDWIELYNPNQHTVRLDGWSLKDDSGAEYVFPESTIIGAMGYLVVVEDKKQFLDFYTDFSKLYGNLAFGLSGSGESIRLYNKDKQLIDEVSYDDKSPWPIEADGAGAVLALKKHTLNNNEGANWFGANFPGTPGAANGYIFTAIDVNANKSAYKLYPNPANDFVVVELPDNHAISELIVYSITGQQVMKVDVTSEKRIRIDLSGLPAGVYWIKNGGKLIKGAN